MSSEMNVLFRSKLPSKAALTRAMKELGFPLSIAPPAGSLEQQSGFMPMRLRREETGVEFDIFNGRAAVEEVAGEDAGKVDPSFDRSANFRWGGDEDEMLAGMCAAAALARLMNGVVLEENEGLLSADAAISLARRQLAAVAKPRDRRSGTRPADIKRYLKPLLQQRNDLLLVGRLLVIRPVRHLLRGAYFDRTGDRYRFRLCRVVQPLWGMGGVINDDRVGASFEVWQPHFEGLLMASLREDVFDCVGKVATLADFADYQSDSFLDAQVTALVLAGECDRAAERVDEAERYAISHGFSNEWIREHWEHLTKDVEATCAAYHAREAANIKGLKLEHIWEPSPFPVELPAAERASKSADPVFPITPWITEPPSPLREAPQDVGDVRFAKDFLGRHDRLLLVAPLTPEEAEERHREREDYVLAVRLPDGVLLMIARHTHWDRNEPPQSYRTRPSGPSFRIKLYGPTEIATVSTSRRQDGGIDLRFFGVRERLTSREIWYCSTDVNGGEKRVWDDRTGQRVFSKTELTLKDRDLLACPVPEFGDYAVLAERFRSLLRNVGYGEIA